MRLPFVSLPVAAALLCALAAAPSRASTATPARLDSLIAAETRVAWTPGPPDSALARARREGRPAFLDFYATWCAPCRWMDRAVYNDPLLAEAAEAVVMIRVDIDRPEGRALARRYDIVEYPTLVYVRPDGREMLRWVGPLGLRDTRLNLGQISVPADGRAAVEAERTRRPRDVGTQVRVLLWYAWRGEVERVRTLAAALDTDLATDPAAPGRASDLAVVRLALAKAEEIAGHPRLALAAYQAARDADPAGAFAWRAWLGISTCLDALHDPAGAAEAAGQARARNPLRWLDARVARLALESEQGAPPLPPGVDDPAADGR